MRSKVAYLHSGLDWFWEGFTYLSARRQWGFGAPQPISVHDISAYIALIGLQDPDDVKDFMVFVDMLDSEWLSLYVKDKG